MITLLRKPLDWARWLYDWVVALAAKPGAAPTLGVISAAESIVFPIPPDAMLIPMCVARPRRSLHYAAICLLGSIMGAAIGYWLGATAMESVGKHIVLLYGLETKLERMFELYRDYDAWIVMIAGFTPIPYKLITLSSGAAAVNFPVFLIASIVSRGARFFLVAGLLMAFGDRAAVWIDRHFDRLTIAFVILLVGFIALSTM